MSRRGLPGIAAIITLGVLLMACSTTSSTSATSDSSTLTTGSSSTRTWQIVALGDSVPRGTNCHCTPYPPLTGGDLTALTGQSVEASNDSVAGATTSDLLRQLDADRRTIDRVRTADVVEIEIGANDVGYSDSCGTDAACYAAEVSRVGTNLAEIVARVHELASGHPVLVVLLNYWSVWLGGQYAAAQGQSYVDAAASVTGDVNAAIATTATNTGSAYVDVRAAFKGPDYADDETRYLSDDGDHPNAEGHQTIAAATVAVIVDVLHL